jgi:glycosyltransferase involved in cell wall biosynthesis
MTPDVSGRPLLTLGLIAYNQEGFIKNAILGAFSQTYSPLEIILSDDCSSDGTFEVMERMAAAYGGPHRIILSRNECNRGLAGNVNRVFELAHGKLILLAAGDDISLPTRAQVTYEAWEASRRGAMFVYSAFSVIDEADQELENTGLEFSWSNEGTITQKSLSIEEFFGPDKPWFFGCASAWSPRLMEVFGPLPDGLIHDDEALALRAACLGSYVRIALPLVRYRLHGNNVFACSRKLATSLEEIDKEEARSRRELQTRYGMYRAFGADLKEAVNKSLVSQSAFEHAMAVCRRQRRLLKGQIAFHGCAFVRKCRLLLALRKRGLPASEVRRLLPRLLPQRSFRALKGWRNSFRGLIRT